MNVKEKLKIRIRKAGLTYRDIAQVIKKAPGTVAGKLNSFIPIMPEEMREIERAISEALNKKSKNKDFNQFICTECGNEGRCVIFCSYTSNNSLPKFCPYNEPVPEKYATQPEWREQI